MNDKQKMLNLIERLLYYNEWRRGGDNNQPNPKQIGKDIDSSVAIIQGFISLMDDADIK